MDINSDPEPVNSETLDQVRKPCWTWLRNLLKVIEDGDNLKEIIDKTKDSFVGYLGYEKIEIYALDSQDKPKTKVKDSDLDLLASSSFFDKKLIEDVFIKKQPCKRGDNEVVFPLETQDRILGLIFIKDKEAIDDSTYHLLWSFADHLAIKIHDLQIPKLPAESKKKVKEITNSIFNNLRTFLEASIERLRLLEEQNQRLVELDKLRTELINNVSHELRTPLVSIMGFSNILQRHEISPELVKESSEQIRSAGSRLSRMIDDLIQLNRASTRGWETTMEIVDLGEIAKYVIEGLAPLHTQHRFTYHYAKDYPLIEGDRKLMRQIIENLIINAIKYSPDGGEISCMLQVKNNQIYLSIEDEGIGMKPEELERVFERFYRAKNAETDNIPGLGLGLSICKDAVSALNGKIVCKSAYGKGSVFTIAFPCK
jgi:signal transduction histidine kinase